MANYQQKQQWEILLESGRNEPAIASIGAHLAADPSDPEALRYLSRAMISLERPKEAETAARQSLATEPDNDWGLRLLAVSLGHQGKDVEAILISQAAIEAAPLSPRVWSAASDRLVAARFASKPGRRPNFRRMARGFRPLAAVGFAKHAVALEPDNADSMLALSRAYYALTDRQRAMAVLALILRSNPDHQEAQRRLAAIDRRDGRWVALGMTAELLSFDDARHALRSTSVHDVSQLAGALHVETLGALRTGRRGGIDDRGVTDAMAVAADPDVGRWAALQIRIRLFAAGIVQAAVGLVGGTNRVCAALVIAALAMTGSALTYTAARTRAAAWRAIARRQLLTSWTIVMVALNVAAAIGGSLTLFGVYRSGLKAGGSFGLLCVLCLFVSVTRRDLAAYRILMPSANTFISAFRHVRAIATTCMLAGFASAVVAVVLDTSRPGSFPVRLVCVSGAVLVVVTSLVAVRGRNAAIRRASRSLARNQMRWVMGSSAVVWLAGVTALVAERATVAVVSLSAAIVAFQIIILWTVGEMKYLPGMGAATRTFGLAVRRRRTKPNAS